MHFFKKFSGSVSFKYTLLDVCSCIHASIIRIIDLQISDYMSNWDFSYWNNIAHDSGFSRIHLGWLDSLNVLLFFCHGNLLFCTCLHLYIFAVRHVNSVLNWMSKWNLGGHSNFRRTVIYAYQKILGASWNGSWATCSFEWLHFESSCCPVLENCLGHCLHKFPIIIRKNYLL